MGNCGGIGEPRRRGAQSRASGPCLSASHGNDWNNEHRWPKASVLKLKRENRSVAFVELAADIPVRHGASRRMLDDFTGRVVHGTFEFFNWLHEQREPRPVTQSEPAADF
jgi:Putative bacterial sensory transduction regulator